MWTWEGWCIQAIIVKDFSSVIFLICIWLSKVASSIMVIFLFLLSDWCSFGWGVHQRLWKDRMQLMSSELQLLPDYGHRLHGPKLLQGFWFAASVIISSSAISILYAHDTFVCMVYHMYHMSYHHIIFVSDISVTFLHHDIFVTSALGPSSSHNVASPPQFVLSVLRILFMTQIKISCVIQN